MSTKNKTILGLVLIVFISSVLMKALFHPGFYTSHDGWHIVARLFHFDQAIKDGHIPPRWAGGLYNGFGYPLFVFSYQLPWWLAEPLVLAGFSIFDALKAIFIVTFTLSGVLMFLWIKDMWGPIAAFISAVVYLVTPYRFANILVRANLGEAVGLMFVPLIFWSVYRLHRNISIASVLLGAIGITGLLLSHVMAGALFSLSAVLYILVLLSHTKQKLKFLVGLLSTALLSLGLSAYYFLPAVYYRPVTVFKEIFVHLYREHFTPLVKLIYSPWGYGALGTPGEMSRQVGLVLWLVWGLSVLGAIFMLIKKVKVKKIDYWTGLVFIMSYILAIFLMTKNSSFLWKLWEGLTLVDFPWRLLAVTTLCGSVLAGWITNFMPQKFKLALVTFLVIGVAYTNRNHLRVNQYTDIPLSLYIDSELTTNTYDEYLPQWVNRDLTQEKREFIQAKDFQVSSLRQTSHQIKFDYQSSRSQEIKVHHMFFPGWQVQIDDQSSELKKDEGGSIKIFAPSGSHSVLMEYKPTTIMMWSSLLSLASIMFIFGVIIYNFKKKYLVV